MQRRGLIPLSYFNGTKGEDGKYKGRDIFSDYINISSIGTYYENKFEELEEGGDF